MGYCCIVAGGNFSILILDVGGDYARDDDVFFVSAALGWGCGLLFVIVSEFVVCCVARGWFELCLQSVMLDLPIYPYTASTTPFAVDPLPQLPPQILFPNEHS